MGPNGEPDRAIALYIVGPQDRSQSREIWPVALLVANPLKTTEIHIASEKEIPIVRPPKD